MSTETYWIDVVTVNGMKTRISSSCSLAKLREYLGYYSDSTQYARVLYGRN